MKIEEFFTLLLPEAGYIIIAEPKAYTDKQTNKVVSYFKHYIHASIPAAVEQVADMVEGDKDVFFALSTFREARVWNPNVPNKDGTKGKFQSRSQSNSLALKSFFLDLDIDPAPTPEKATVTFLSKADAIDSLKHFCRKVGMPKPMVVDSGGGIHCYWPLATEVPTDRWMVAALKFKSICLHESLRIDPAVPADSARVLRVLGSNNMKRGTARPVTLLGEANGRFDVSMYESLFDTFIEANNVTGVTKGYKVSKSLVSTPPSILGDNIGATNYPSNPDQIAFHCRQFAIQLVNRGAGAGEVTWHNMLGIAKFCTPQLETAMAVSDGHPNYDRDQMLEKMNRWPGPAPCARINENNKGICDTCPHLGKLTSPITLGKSVPEEAPPEVKLEIPGTSDTQIVQIPNPPAPYKRYKGTIVIETEDKDGKPKVDVISPFDIYPARIIRQTGADNDVKESTLWCVHLDRVGLIHIDIPQTVLSDYRRLQALLFEKGAYPHPHLSKEMQTFMSAYLRELARTQDREKAYDVLGWHKDIDFVIGETVVHRDGTTTKHKLSVGAANATKSSVGTSGTLEGWKDTMRFFNAPGYEGSRMLLYASFAAPIFYMSTFKAVTISASGETGRGKSTAMEAQASVWGDPSKYVINGNNDGSTINALYHNLGVYHNLPYLIDDTTERPSDDMRKFYLNAPQGKGKERMKGNEHDGKVSEWATIITTSTNMNDILQIGKDSQPHIMRMFPIWFELLDSSTEAKIKADAFRRGMAVNYGHAGIEFMKYVMTHMDEIRNAGAAAAKMVDRDVNAQPHERYWTACIAYCVVAAQIVISKLGLLEYDLKSDYEWMKAQLIKMRGAAAEAATDPIELLNDFLNASLPNTIVVSAKATSNIDNIAIRPHGALHVHHDFDQGGIFVARNVFIEYCVKRKINFKSIEDALYKDGIIVNKHSQKTLGADTAYAKGQTKCWKISAAKLGNGFINTLQTMMQSQQAVP